MGNIQAANIHSSDERSFSGDTGGDGARDRSEISLQGAGFFTASTSGNGTAYSATETGGFLTTYRYHLNHWAAAEATYGYDANSQKYFVLHGSIPDSVGDSSADRKLGVESSVSQELQG